MHIRHCLLMVACVALAMSASCTPEPVNYALPVNGGSFAGPRNSSDSAQRPPVANDGRFDGYAWAFLDTPLVIRFDQPRTINALDLLLYHEQEAWYQFVVEVRGAGEGWTKVADRTTGQPRGWQRVDFPPVECAQVRIVFTGTSQEAKSYHVVEVGAFLLSGPQQPSPLRASWLAHQKTNVQSWYDVFLGCLGPNAVMPPEHLARVKAGERLTTDLDGDGDPDLCDFLDTDPKHTMRPMVVRAVDDDDDMPADGTPDLDSDCYIADWRGNGTVDRAIDYWDDDGDGDADRMDLYYPADGWHGQQVEVVIIRDVGDDNRMWHTINYEYQQYTCQWQSDFNGDEIFCMFGYDRASKQWVAHLEEPFTHHDLDRDGVAELTIQFLGQAPFVGTIRFSLDADNDSSPTNRRDYDFSFNCGGLLTVRESKSTRHKLRNGELTGPYLDWQYAREQAESGAWKTCSLCWDETDNNVNPADPVERVQERWEGVGGYQMREGNKRWETDKDYSGKMALYYWPADRRLHLLGAETGYINVDYNHDYQVDAKITYQDRDGDGFFDQWSYDADGTPEHVVNPPAMKCEIVPVEYAQFVKRYRKWVQEALTADERLIATLKRVLEPEARSVYEQWWLAQTSESFYAAKKLHASAEARRYYLDLACEEMFLRARERFTGAKWWPAFQAAYEAGRYEQAAAIIPPG